MKLLIVSATRMEIAGWCAHFALPSVDFIQRPDFDVLVTGVGMTATAFRLGQTLSKNYNLVLNVGIAGSFDQALPPGTLVQVADDTFAELGAENREEFISIDQLGFGKGTFKATNVIQGLTKVSAITVNKVHGNASSIEKIKGLFPVQVESMEGAAVFFACEQVSVPCVQVRCISNYVEPRNKDNWQIGLAIKNLNNWLISFIDNYNHLR